MLRRMGFAIGLVLAQASGTALGIPIINLSDSTSGLTSTSITPGGSFTLKSVLDTTSEPVAGVTYFLQADTAGSGFFSITGRTSLASNPFPDPTTSNAEVVTNGSLSPKNGRDLGYSNDFSTNAAAGTYDIDNLTLMASAAIPLGTYTLQSATVSTADINFDEFFATSFPTFTINIVPEPASMVLLAGSVLTLTLRRRRRI